MDEQVAEIAETLREQNPYQICLHRQLADTAHTTAALPIH